MNVPMKFLPLNRRPRRSYVSYPSPNPQHQPNEYIITLDKYGRVISSTQIQAPLMPAEPPTPHLTQRPASQRRTVHRSPFTACIDPRCDRTSRNHLKNIQDGELGAVPLSYEEAIARSSRSAPREQTPPTPVHEREEPVLSFDAPSDDVESSQPTDLQALFSELADIRSRLKYIEDDVLDMLSAVDRVMETVGGMGGEV